MAKVPKLKQREPSKNSRAARREEPTEEIAKGAVVESDYKPWLHSTQTGGVQKKQKKKVLTRAQKARQQKGVERAEADAEKLEKKIADSKKSASNIKARAADWEDLNEHIVAKKDAQRKKEREGKIEQPVALTAGDRDGDEVLPDLATAPTITSTQPTAPISDAPAWASMHATTEDFVVDEVT